MFLIEKRILSFKLISSLRYALKFKKWPDFNSPRDLNEKVMWLSFYSDTSLWSKLADKIEVRNYVESKGLKELLPRLLGAWDHADEIDFDKLPNSFVLKTNHGCGEVLVIKDKRKEDLTAVKNKMNGFLQSPFGILTGEPHYLAIKPRVFAEEMLPNDSKFSTSLVDYKFYCFYGKPECVLVCYDRKGLNAQKVIYDMAWQKREDYTHAHNQTYPEIPKPYNWDKMLKACSILGLSFPFVRIDFYETQKRCYFGEMTFTPASGRSTAESKDYLKYLGSKININQIKEQTNRQSS